MPFSQYIRLVDIMARMALRADASRFFLGYIWWVLEPLLWVAVFYVVFVMILAQRQADFLVFLMTGKLVFVWFSKSVTQASSSIVNSKGLVGKINVPKTLFPMAMVQEGLYRQVAVFALLFSFPVKHRLCGHCHLVVPGSSDPRNLRGNCGLCFRRCLPRMPGARLHSADFPGDDVFDVYLGHFLGCAGTRGSP